MSFAYCIETERCKSLENIVFCLGEKKKKIKKKEQALKINVIWFYQQI